MIPLSILRQKQEGILRTFLDSIEDPQYPLSRNPFAEDVMHRPDEDDRRFSTLLNSRQFLSVPRQLFRFFEALSYTLGIAIPALMKAFAPDRITCKFSPFDITFLHRGKKIQQGTALNDQYRTLFGVTVF